MDSEYNEKRGLKIRIRRKKQKRIYNGFDPEFYFPTR
jgi:hypothetical protein